MMEERITNGGLSVNTPSITADSSPVSIAEATSLQNYISFGLTKIIIFVMS